MRNQPGGYGNRGGPGGYSRDPYPPPPPPSYMRERMDGYVRSHVLCHLKALKFSLKTLNLHFYIVYEK